MMGPMKQLSVQIFLGLLTLLFLRTTFAAEVLVIANKRHISLSVPMSQVPPTFLPTDVDYLNYNMLDLSMGQDPYFYLPDPSIFTGIKVLLKKSATVIRLHPFSTDPEVNFEKKNVLAIDLSDAEIQGLLKYVDADIAEKTMKGQLPEDGKYFYQAKGIYTVNNTCVTWAVNALRSAGLPLYKTKKIPRLRPLKVWDAIAKLPKTRVIVDRRKK